MVQHNVSPEAAADAGVPQVSASAEWVRITCACAVGASAIDALLLQRKQNLFTGGFLAPDYLRGPREVLLFCAGSLLSDAAVVGVLVALGLLLAQRLRLNRSATRLFVASLGLLPVTAADVVSYELVRYLGDAFDLSLMFDLTGRSVQELLAVSFFEVGALLVVALAATLVLVAAMRWLNRRAVDARFVSATPPRRLALPAVVLFLVGLMASVAIRAQSASLDNLRRKPTGQLLTLVLSRATDRDRDGYSPFDRPPDRDENSDAIHPYAVDYPGNGIDENGVAGDLPFAASVYRESRFETPAWRVRPPVLLIVLESFRADLVGARHHGRAVTPVLNRLAAAGVSLDSAYSHNGYTAQSRFHLLTGSLTGQRGSTSLLDDFKANGYEVGYFSAQDESFGGARFAVGLRRADFFYDARQDRDRRYSTFSTAGSLAVPSRVLLDRIRAFLERRRRSAPLMLYVNFHDLNFPYTHSDIAPLVSNVRLAPGAIAPQRADALRAMYANTAANVDRAVGHVVEAMRRAVGTEPALIVTADHGESLFDGGFLGHGYALNDAQTRVPLIVTGAPLIVHQPFGQAELRDAINAAFSVPPADLRERAVTDDRKRVFQYLGVIERPRQIGFLETTGRVLYDFRSERASVRGGHWKRLDALTAPEAASVRDLVYHWEAMMLARRNANAERPKE